MKIVHILSYFKPDAAYQENLLTRGQQEIGNDVTIISSTLEPKFSSNVGIRNHPKGVSYYYGVKLIRYKPIFEIVNRFVIWLNLYGYIKREKPDLIFFHDHDPNILICCMYVFFNRKTKLITDIHTSYENSMGSIFGPFYHKFYLRNLIKLTKKFCCKIFAVSPEAKKFAYEVYQIEEEKLELLPLPGDANLTVNYDAIRDKIRKKFSIADDEILLVHTGKLPEDKKTFELIRAFKNLSNKYKLIIAGSVSDDYKNQFDEEINHPSINYIGWVSPISLREIFMGADMLVQPGSLSNTFLDALCCRLPLLLKDTPQGQFLTNDGNGILIKNNDEKSITASISSIHANNLLEMKKAAKLKYKNYHYTEIAKLSLKNI